MEAVELEDYLRRTLVEDMQKRPPGLVMVDRAPRKQGLGSLEVDLLAYLLTDPAFEAIWRRYESLGRIGRFQVFRRTS